MIDLFFKLVLALGLSCLSFFCSADENNHWDICPTSPSSENGAAVEDGDQLRWNISLSPYTHHWRYSPDHKPVFLASLEKRWMRDRFCGVALFRNSFGQPSTYVYVGKQWDGVLDNPKLFTKVSAGLIYGYKGKYQHKIPFNDYGIAPAVIPSLGWQFNRQESAQVMVLGTAGLLFAYGKSF
jgi:hypothetical protein